MARIKVEKDATETVSEVPRATGEDENGNPTITWERPTGFSLTTAFNEATVAYALENGWKPLAK
jgi:hypothetical protein